MSASDSQFPDHTEHAEERGRAEQGLAPLVERAKDCGAGPGAQALESERSFRGMGGGPVPTHPPYLES